MIRLRKEAVKKVVLGEEEKARGYSNTANGVWKERYSKG
jgi:hypothetical protein